MSTHNGWVQAYEKAIAGLIDEINRVSKKEGSTRRLVLLELTDEPIETKGKAATLPDDDPKCVRCGARLNLHPHSSRYLSCRCVRP